MKRIGLIIGLIGFCLPLFGQLAPSYDQYMFNGLAINPAYAGSQNCMQSVFVLRKQWLGFPGSPSTANLTLHGPLGKGVNNVGLSYTYDQLGAGKQNVISGNYAYRLQWGKAKLAFGLRAGVGILQTRYTSVYTDEPGDVLFSEDSPKIVLPQFGFGAWYTQEKFYVGFSIPELLQIKTSSYNQFYGNDALNQFYMLTGGFLIDLNKEFKLKPSMLIKYAKGFAPQFDFNTNVIYRDMFWFGASFRTQESILGMFEYQANRQIRIGYSYGKSIGAAGRWESGTHEFLISYRFGFVQKTNQQIYF